MERMRRTPMVGLSHFYALLLSLVLSRSAYAELSVSRDDATGVVTVDGPSQHIVYDPRGGKLPTGLLTLAGIDSASWVWSPEQSLCTPDPDLRGAKVRLAGWLQNGLHNARIWETEVIQAKGSTVGFRATVHTLTADFLGQPGSDGAFPEYYDISVDYVAFEDLPGVLLMEVLTWRTGEEGTPGSTVAVTNSDMSRIYNGIAFFLPDSIKRVYALYYHSLGTPSQVEIGHMTNGEELYQVDIDGTPAGFQAVFSRWNGWSNGSGLCCRFIGSFFRPYGTLPITPGVVISQWNGRNSDGSPPHGWIVPTGARPNTDIDQLWGVEHGKTSGASYNYVMLNTRLIEELRDTSTIRLMWFATHPTEFTLYDVFDLEKAFNDPSDVSVVGETVMIRSKENRGVEIVALNRDVVPRLVSTPYPIYHGRSQIVLVKDLAAGRLVEIGWTGSLPLGVDGLRSFEIFRNHPNPFNASTIIGYYIPSSSEVELSIYTINGQRIRRLVNEAMFAGEHRVVWSGVDDYGREVGSGVYFYRLTTAEGALTRRMVLVR